MSSCYVAAKDYALHFKRVKTQPLPVPEPWNGSERRTIATDRRVGHDRRWQTATGRRFRLSDRRNGPRT